MRNFLVMLAVLSLSSLALADKARMTPGNYPEKAAAWKRFTVKDVQLGAVVDKLAGFTCSKDAGQYRHTCVKFLDERCKGLRTYIHEVSRAHPAESQGCTYDHMTGSGGGTYLNGQYVKAPLINVAVVGTDTDVPRAYEIRYAFAKDALVDDSKLSKALVEKYGKPDYTNAPWQLRWQAAGMDNDLYLAAECTTEGEGAHCVLEAHDGPLLDAERGIKKAFEDQLARKNAADPDL